MTIKIEPIEEGWEFRYRIINTETQYEEKAYSLQGAERIKEEMEKA